jgi:hypothetical protein
MRQANSTGTGKSKDLTTAGEAGELNVLPVPHTEEERGQQSASTRDAGQCSVVERGRFRGQCRRQA